ncbi:uncharacterized protein A4U43_C01F2280 [Asparagus officinalis]|uniref:AN1-type domain-containing protein n=1 Tax=Asparagus officinalis TaxID=4686 RepID=A0A5P1FMS8_ASPOF|nr:uncharacterized protein A4U43_C01F2280 [Asparagus officinalis]
MINSNSAFLISAGIVVSNLVDWGRSLRQRRASSNRKLKQWSTTMRLDAKLRRVQSSASTTAASCAATMNMCSKCHKDLVLKQEHAKLAASSIDSIVNGSGSTSGKEPLVSASVDVAVASVEPKIISAQPSDASVSSESSEPKAKEGPTRCNACKKRVGLTGFNCRCGNVFCAMHRYSEKHNCPFDYRTAARDAIAKANPVVKAEKLDKI